MEKLFRFIEKHPIVVMIIVIGAQVIIYGALFIGALLIIKKIFF